MAAASTTETASAAATAIDFQIAIMSDLFLKLVKISRMQSEKRQGELQLLYHAPAHCLQGRVNPTTGENSRTDADVLLHEAWEMQLWLFPPAP